MRCKKHYTDLSSTIGVCSSCLRERLIHVIAIQEQHNQTLETLKHHNSVKLQPPSHLTSRKSDYSDPPRHHHHHHSHSDQLFYTTPQVTSSSSAPKKRSFIRFLSLQNFFRSRHKTEDDDATSSSSWISSILHRRKKTVHVEEPVVTGPVRRQYCRDRGMSPAGNSDDEGGACDESTTESWKNTPRRTGRRGHARNGSGLTFCVSPYIVRPSPNRQWNDGGGVSGEIRVANLMNTKAFCANRSRKLADFGRPVQNR